MASIYIVTDNLKTLTVPLVYFFYEPDEHKQDPPKDTVDWLYVFIVILVSLFCVLIVGGIIIIVAIKGGYIQEEEDEDDYHTEFNPYKPTRSEMETKEINRTDSSFEDELE